MVCDRINPVKPRSFLIWCVIPMTWMILVFSFPVNAHSSWCEKPQDLGASPKRLIVVVPGTTQGAKEWSSFLEFLRKEKESEDLAWMVYEHHIGPISLGNARDVSIDLASCIDEKVNAFGYQHVTIIGHSIGGMLARYAYLHSSGAFPGEHPSPNSWAKKVDKILLFASVNKGIRSDVRWWGTVANWVLRTFPHPRFILEDVALGSHFIADIRIAWIRHFGNLQNASLGSTASVPHVVQFWGENDSIVNEKDNADLEAFSGKVIRRISGAQHGNLQRLEPEYVSDPESRWTLFRHEIFEEPLKPSPSEYKRRRVLIIARGIRDSSNSEWVSTLSQRAKKFYGEDNIETIEYGYFSAVHFALKPLRTKNIPRFRDVYAQRLAENPLTEFDFIGHSNGTYIFGHSLDSTKSMKFENVVLAAPVLPTNFGWQRLFQQNQVKAVRYDVAQWDWPVGILCQALRAIGFSDVGPSGLALFEEGRDRRVDISRGRQGPEHPLQTASQRTQHGVHPSFDRERHRRHPGVLRL